MMVTTLVALVLGGLLAVVQPTACSSITVETTGGCPVCDALFSNLETTPTGERVQIVSQQQRGEPKSGTALIFYWAASAIFRSCDYLKYHFGQESCTTWVNRNDGSEGSHGNRTVMFDFQPHRGRETARCPCNDVDRVQLLLYSIGKHSLPVANECEFAHPKGISNFKLCQFPGGGEVQGYPDLFRCMSEAACPITDDRDQLVILRDPRAMTVSSYYFGLVHDISNLRELSLDEFVFSALPSITQWVGIRYILFEGLMADRSTVIYYEDMLGDPVGFHYQYLHSVGLQMPFNVVQNMADEASRGNFTLKGVKGMDPHPGGANATGSRSFKDEVSEEVLEKMNEVVRVWLPSVLLARFGITP